MESNGAAFKKNEVTEGSLRFDWVYCNGCGRPYLKTPQLQYSYLHCGHMYCGKCSKNPDYANCQLCHMTKVKKVPLESSIILNDFASIDYKVVFKTPGEMMKNMYRVVDFQSGHMTNFLKMYREKLENMEKKIETKTKEFTERKAQKETLMSRKQMLMVLLQCGNDRLAKLEAKEKTNQKETSEKKYFSSYYYHPKTSNDSRFDEMDKKLTKKKIESGPYMPKRKESWNSDNHRWSNIKSNENSNREGANVFAHLHATPEHSAGSQKFGKQSEVEEIRSNRASFMENYKCAKDNVTETERKRTYMKQPVFWSRAKNTKS